MALVPPGVVTVTSTVPVPAGDVTVIEVVVSAVTVPVTEPNFAAVAPPRLVPVMTTEVPPPLEPEVGLMPVTVGRLGAALVALNSTATDEDVDADDWTPEGDTAPVTLVSKVTRFCSAVTS